MNMPVNQTAVIDLHYLPSIEYFTALLAYENIRLEANEFYEKQSYRTRCHILSANKVDMLSVPVIGGRKKIVIKDIKIDHSQGWQKNHWRAIQSAYGRAPFYEFFADYFEPFFSKQEKYLFDFNYKLLSTCLKLLGIKKNIEFTDMYQKPSELVEIDDLRSVIHPKRPYASNPFYQPVSYPQVFGKNFADNLSIIDILFCEGPNAKALVTKSMVAE